MSESLARFRELKGVGPAIEARLHEAGVFTWEALSQVTAALGSVRSATGETLQDLSGRIAEQASAAGASGPRPPNAERNEAFIVRIALGDGGEPIRSSVTHVRSQTEKSSAGWPGDELFRFIEEHAGMVASTTAPAVAEQPVVEEAPAAPARRPSRVHVSVLDAGKAIGGASRDIELVLATDEVGDIPELAYQATLRGRPFGQGRGPVDLDDPGPPGRPRDRVRPPARPLHRGGAPPRHPAAPGRGRAAPPRAQRGRAEADARLAGRTVSRAARPSGPSPP